MTKYIFLAVLVMAALAIAMFFITWAYRLVHDVALLGVFFSYILLEGSNYV